MKKEGKKNEPKKKKDNIYIGKDYPNTELKSYDNGMYRFCVFNDTLRTSVVVFVGDLGEKATREFFMEELKNVGLENEYEYNTLGLHLHNIKYGSIIFLKTPDLGTLIHELNHAKQAAFQERGIFGDEIESYYLEFLIRSILSLDKESGNNLFSYVKLSST